MALRGWRLFGVAGTILVYVGGILVLSFVSLQGPQRKRGVHGPRGYGEFETLRNRDLGLMGKKPPLQWCTELHYRDAPARVPRKPPKLLQTFPGHFVKNLVASPATGKGSSSSQSVWPNNGDAPSGKLVDSDSVRSSDGQLRRSKPELAALVSFPGSGNTWLRYLLQQATGILTGSVYKDYGLLKSGFPAESVANSSVLVVKTHEWGPNAWAPYTKAILLVRDPERAILAEFNRQSGGHVGFASPDRYRRTKGRYWTQFVKNKLWAWEQTNLSWAKNFTGEVKLVFYDDLVANVEGTLRSILKFLNHTPDEELLACALMRKEGIYRRKKRILQFDPYSPAMHAAIDEKRAEVYAALGRYDAQ
ncbi:AGAP003962-PA-like protein [Anopheles sinensis]|uniref:AGAP003962-PA-like protein n=1 Tax=Anopheles sinensis TaxID=74873 RepID=A0A084VGD5_ANOSI|nr:AGAP003962-PA-like protein [Anopheles sinensis]